MDAAVLISHARHAAHLSLRALATRSGTSHATISAYETGRVTPTVDTLDRILRAAGFTAAVGLRRSPMPRQRNGSGRARSSSRPSSSRPCSPPATPSS